jgi:hypothetical protein
MAKVPFTAGKDFSQLGVIGKVTTVSTIVASVVGAFFTVWQTVAFASERTDLYVTEIFKEQTPYVVEVELKGFQQQQQIFYYGNQMQIMSLELRSIESEMSAITRGKTPTQLTADDVSRLETLRSDRDRIKSQITNIRSQQQQLQLQQQM